MFRISYSASSVSFVPLTRTFKLSECLALQSNKTESWWPLSYNNRTLMLERHFPGSLLGSTGTQWCIQLSLVKYCPPVDVDIQIKPLLWPFCYITNPFYHPPFNNYVQHFSLLQEESLINKKKLHRHSAPVWHSFHPSRVNSLNLSSCFGK